MDLTKLKFTPFAEGFIRVAATTGTDGTLTSTGGFEILARHHDSEKKDATGIPRLANHSIEQQLVDMRPANKKANKIVEIPIKMFFDKPSNAISASYVAYDNNGIPVCRGNGCDAQRREMGEGGLEVISAKKCSGNENCDLIRGGTVTCKRQISMAVQIAGQENPLTVFEVRTSSYNTLKALRGQLELVAARFGGLRHVPLKLEIWKASNQASNFEPFDLIKINLDADSESAAMRDCKRDREADGMAQLAASCDEAFETLAAVELDLGQIEEFTVVSDFYQPIHNHKAATRRVGSTSVASQMQTGTSGAEDFIRAAVNSAAQAKDSGRSTEAAASAA